MSDGLDPEKAADSAQRGQETDIHSIHRSITREKDDPTDGFEPIPLWMTIAFGAPLFWGGLYMSANSGEYRMSVLDRPNPKYDPSPAKVEKLPETEEEYFALGKKVYNNCVGCHQATGVGQAPPAGCPPLAGSEWVAGSEASEARLARILLYGLAGPIRVKGQDYGGGQMPAWSAVLKDHQIAGVITYIRSEWGNKENVPNKKPMVTTKMVAEAKKKEGARGVMSAEQLKALPIGYYDDPSTAPAGGAAVPAAPVMKK